MQHLFDKCLNNYLASKIKLANDTSTKIINEYGREDAIRTEIIRLRVIIEKGINGTITDKVNTSNVINKYKVSKEIDTERYPTTVQVRKRFLVA
jgi:ATP-dependent Lon protease